MYFNFTELNGANKTIRLDNAEDYDDLADEKTLLITTRKAEKTPLLSMDTHSQQLSNNDIDGFEVRERANTNASSDDETFRMIRGKYGKFGVEFESAVEEAVRAIGNAVYPELISQGSSGSYFVLDMNRRKIAVFKPKNEEPYGQLNPKWLKWFHKIFFPCCFGRSCLIPNQGYLSEAGASIIDSKLGLGIVPKTAVVDLAAPTFNYSRVDRALSRSKVRIQARYPELGKHFRHVGLPPKTGSFQLFMHDYKEAEDWLRQWQNQTLSSETQKSLQHQFERLVILDYIIRNTDRGSDNWLISYEIDEEKIIELSSTKGIQYRSDEGPSSVPTIPTINEDVSKADADGSSPNIAVPLSNEDNDERWETVDMPPIRIAAIDNGLAFPFKHPESWRSYPYGWANLSLAHQPFSQETVAKVLPLIENTSFVLELGKELRECFKTDGGFDKKTFGKQLSVMYGQIYNLKSALSCKPAKTPAELVQMRPIYMVEIKKQRKQRRNKNHVSGTTNIPFMDDDGNEEVRITTTGGGPSSSNAESQMSPTIEFGMDTRSWHHIFKQKVQTRSPFLQMW